MRKALVLTLLILSLAACSVVTPAPVKEKMQITVSIAPQAWLVKSLTGDLADVQSMVNPGDDPHTYEPKPSQMQVLAQTDIYFTIGVEYELAWMPRLSNANGKMRVVDVTAGVNRLPSDNHAAGETSAENEADPHIWFSAQRMKIVAKNTADALVSFNPVNKSVYDQNLAIVLEKIDSVDAAVREKLTATTQKKFLIMHPMLAYFAADYGLEQLPVEIGGQEPSPSELANLLDLAEQNQIKALYLQRNTSLKMAETVANALGIKKIYELEPLAEDWPANMLEIASLLAEGLN
jgi:zinc transport system substrate-binding protein